MNILNLLKWFKIESFTFESKILPNKRSLIVSGIGSKSVIIIRFNPDLIRHRKEKIDIHLIDRCNYLHKFVSEEISSDYDAFIVKIIQMYYDDPNEEYKMIREENITFRVCV